MVRVALFVDPETAQIHAVSDPIPDVFGGAKLEHPLGRRRRRPERTSRSTRPAATRSPSRGDPRTAAAPTRPTRRPSAPSPVSAPVPDHGLRRARLPAEAVHPAVRRPQDDQARPAPEIPRRPVARAGDANISRAALTLPHSEFLDQAHIRTICTRVQLAAHDCPPGSIYGYARAQTPLLDDELAGPVYLVSSDHELPDLLADLQGQVDVRLRGVISAGQGADQDRLLPPFPTCRSASSC